MNPVQPQHPDQPQFAPPSQATPPAPQWAPPQPVQQQVPPAGQLPQQAQPVTPGYSQPAQHYPQQAQPVTPGYSQPAQHYPQQAAYQQQQFPPNAGAPAPWPQPTQVAGYGTFHQQVLRRKQQSVVVPVVIITLGSLSVLAFMLLSLNRPVVMTSLAVITFSVIAALGVWFFVWIDRWEPEPSYLLIGAFIWGAGIAGAVSAVINTAVYRATGSLITMAMYSAPLVEESTKGLFIVVVFLLSKRGRAELNSLTDAIVYGGLVGLGFAWIEHITYALNASTINESIEIIVVRIILTCYLHTIMTIIVAIGTWYGFRARGVLRLVFPFVGWVLAVFVHFVHNGSYQLMGPMGIFVAAALELAITITIIVLAIKARGKERDAVRNQLPALVHFGWVSGSQAGWLADLKARKAMTSLAGQHKELLKDFVQNATELCLLRSRLATLPHHRVSPEMLALHHELVFLLTLQKPNVDAVLQQGRGWSPIAPAPGQHWGAIG